MRPSNPARLSVLLGLLILLLTGAAADAVISLEDPQDDRVVWTNREADVAGEKTLEAGLECRGDYQGHRINITRGSEIVETENTSTIRHRFDSSSETGKYTVVGSCLDPQAGWEKSNRITFHVARLKTEIIQPGFDQTAYRGFFMGDTDLGRLYKGEEVRVNLTAEGTPDDFSIPKRELSFDVRLSDYNNPANGLSTNFIWCPTSSGKICEDIDGRNIAKLRPYMPADVPGGHHAIELDTFYSSDNADFFEATSTRDNAVYLTGVKTVSKSPDKPTRDNLNDITLTLDVEQGYRKYIADESFYIRIDPEDEYTGNDPYKNRFDVVQSTDDASRYRLKLVDKPKLPKKGDFRAEILFEDPEKLSTSQKKIEIASFLVTKDVIFEGYVQDSNGRPVDTSFTVFSGDSELQFDTRRNGFYSKRLEPGNKTFDVTFRHAGLKNTLNLQNVEVEKEFSSKVSFDYSSSPGNMQIPGVDPVNRMSMVFGTPFQERGSRATMRFRSSSVDFQETSLYECRNWRFREKECDSGWKKIPEKDVTRIPIPLQQKVSFPVEPLDVQYYNETKNILTSAYVIGTRSGLRVSRNSLVLKGTSDGDRIQTGEELELEGRISSGESGVSGAEVNVTMWENGKPVKSFSGETSGDGSFDVRGSAPPEPGNYSLKLEASHSLYDSVETDLNREVWVYRKEELLLVRESTEQPKIQIGEESAVAMELRNTGQTVIEDVILSGEGFDKQYYSFSKPRVNQLEPGSSEKFEVKFNIPASYCEPSCGNDELFPELDVSAKGTGEKGKTVSGVSLPMVLEREGQTAGSDNRQQSPETRNSSKQDGGGSTGSFSMSDIPGARATGEFLASQSTLNIALGLIMVFLMVMAGAVKKKNSGGGREDRRNVVPQQGAMNSMGGRPPTVKPGDQAFRSQDEQQEDEEDGEQESNGTDDVDRMAEAMEDGGEQGEEQTGVKCDVCGEEFDNEAGVKLHKQTAH